MFNIVGSICVGDKTSCGRTVVTGDATSTVNGRMIARVGDRIDCKYGCTIVNGDSTWTFGGQAVALHGLSKTSRNCTCLSGNNDYHGRGQHASDKAAVPAAADAGIAFIPETAQLLKEDGWVEFRLADQKDEPHAGVRYVVTDPAGQRFEGTLDQDGYARVGPVKLGECAVEFPDLGYSSSVASCPQ